MSEMTRLLALYEGEFAAVLDAGSYHVNGNFRALVTGRGWTYTGLDAVAGPNVDVVAPQYAYPFADGAFDVVISGSTMEHVEQPWRWVPELARVLRPGGLLVITTHHTFVEHRYPVDCYRYMPDGMRVMLDTAGCLERYEITKLSDADGTISAAAWKVRR
jgi:SAM-dependent methyltransferase